MMPGFDDDLVQACELAERGVALDGTSAFAIALLGLIQSRLRRYDESLTNFEKAIALAPRNGEVYATYGQVLVFWGNPKKAIEMLEKAFSLETFPPAIWEWQMGHAHLLLRQYDDALSRFHRAVAQAPKFMPAYTYLACAYGELNRLDDARKTIRTVLEFAPGFNRAVVERFFSGYRNNEDRDRLLVAFQKIELPES